MKNIKIFLAALLIPLILLGFNGTGSAYELNRLDEPGLNFATGSRPYHSSLSYSAPTHSILLSKEYKTYLPWMNDTQLRVRLVFEPNLWSKRTPGNTGAKYLLADSGISPLTDTDFLHSNSAPFDESLKLNDPGYGFQISTIFYDSSVNLYFWAGSENTPFNSFSALSSVSPAQSPGLTASSLQFDNPEYYSRNRNIAASWSTDLRFLGFMHQGAAPTIRLETSYRSDEVMALYAVPETGNDLGEFEELSFGLAYEGKNNFTLLDSSYGISWGFGYSYSRALNVPEIVADRGFENIDAGIGTHSGNINASTRWNNMRLMTRVMYLYDIQSKGAMTMMQANFSPDLRWTYGVKANFYDGTKSALWPWADESEHISLSVTYKW